MVYRSSHSDRETGIEQKAEELINEICIWMLDLIGKSIIQYIPL